MSSLAGRWVWLKHAAALLFIATVLKSHCAGGAKVDVWESTPKTVNAFKNNLTITFNDRTALLLADKDGVVGGTGSASARLVWMSCFKPANECFPSADQGDYIAVMDEGILPNILPEIALGDNLPSIPMAIIAIPSSKNTSFSPASTRPLQQYQFHPEGKLHDWNPWGANILAERVPCGVFLAPRSKAAGIKQQAKENTSRGTKGPGYGSSVYLETFIDIMSKSLECLPDAKCLPIGGNSVWAKMPPHIPNQRDSQREQVLVLSHWDSQGLFRSIISGTHSALSGLVAMLVAVDILAKNGKGQDYQRDIVFTSLSGDAFDLTASRRLLYDLDHKRLDARAEENLDGFDIDRVSTIVEVGMLGHDQGAFNGTGGSGGDLFLHTNSGTNANSSAILAFEKGANVSENILTVREATQAYLPPSSLLLWERAKPSKDSVYLGDFDVAFANQNFWNHGDTGLLGWSVPMVAKSATILAQALHIMAFGDLTTPGTLQVNQTEVEEITQQLFDCLQPRRGMLCDLVQDMTDTLPPHTAEQFVSALRGRPSDSDQARDRSLPKKNIERFVWEFLANRTFIGQPHDAEDSQGRSAGCDSTVVKCKAGEVCLHQTGRGNINGGGKCVTANVRFTPSFSTLFEYDTCDNAQGQCKKQWLLPDNDAVSWAERLQLPPDEGWVETFNEDIKVDTNLRENSSRDNALLIAGICCTAAVLAIVLGAKSAHGRLKLD